MKTKLLYLAQNTIESNIIKAELNERNISCYLAGSNLQIAIGELPVDAMYSKVYVNEADFAMGYMNFRYTISPLSYAKVSISNQTYETTGGNENYLHDIEAYGRRTTAFGSAN